MKNMKIRAKLITGFLTVAILTAIVGAVGVFGLLRTSQDAQSINTRNTMAINSAMLLSNIEEQRAAFRGAALKLEIDMAAESQADLDELVALDAEADELLKAIEDSLVTEEARQLTDAVKTAMTTYEENRDAFVAVIDRGDDATADEKLEALTNITEPVNNLVQKLEELDHFLIEATDQQAEQAGSMATVLTFVLLGVVIVAVVVAILLGLYIAGLISKPIKAIVAGARMLAVGDISAHAEPTSRDETGELILALNEMTSGVREQAAALEKISEGDYTMSLPVRSDKDVMNIAINHMLDRNNEMISEIRESSTQVASAAAQIADGAQTLATGSTQQAATLEEFSATISQVQTQAMNNNQLANETLSDTEEAGKLMGESMEYMSQMTQAMETINDSSQNIAKVIKVIDDIAFQTNILALNAAVEAARAGQHGKGFAVVADEVRNLASKSADAAKETAALIETSVENVNRGNEIAERTSESLTKVGEIAAANAANMGKLSTSSEQQSNAITEITQGINQISSVVQANSATAEQSAASAEEMSAQSDLLSKIVSRFQLREGIGGPSSAGALPPAMDSQRSLNMPEVTGGEELF
ncbi:methyl-accepting chemotaxis protein [Ruminococcaceae bacterium OttesenSCG-928-I18]|nr:methyl-accepting chemotaxis protein [Ruminococcaceae bacterium OttesenSCG-928-I18]